MRAPFIAIVVLLVLLGLLIGLGSCTPLGEAPASEPGIEVDIDTPKGSKPKDSKPKAPSSRKGSTSGKRR